MAKLFRVCTLLAVAGITLAVYLLWQQLFRPAFHPCSINSFINCDAIISGEVAKTFEIPTPLFGLVGYCGILLAAITRRKRLLIGLASGGLAFCLWIAYKELVILRVICPVCILCQLIMTSVFAISMVLNRRKE